MCFGKLSSVDEATRQRIDHALRQWVDIRKLQAEKSRAEGRAQEGRRSSVTGGTHLDEINQLIVDEIEATGASGLQLLTNRQATVAGYFRSSKSWDLLVLQGGNPVLTVEYKSMSGSEGKNLNNRADEVFGMAADARAAELHGLLPRNMRRAYVFVLGANEASLRPVGARAAAGTPDPIFTGASYMDRMAIMCERLREEGLFHMAWAVGVHEEPFSWFEPRPTVNWERFSADLRGGFARGEQTRPAHP